DIIDAARIDGSGEFHTFNTVILPILKPAMAVQAIFSFVGAWTELFRDDAVTVDRYGGFIRERGSDCE
ncbi:sugar ABC transporter permease, partial [human gut metagenome]